MKQFHLSRTEKEGLHSVLRRALERAERRKRDGDPSAEREVTALACAIADLDDELAGTS